MTKALEEALETIRDLPEDRQELVADQLLRCLDLMAFEDDRASSNFEEE